MITSGPTTIDIFELFVDWLLLPALRPGEIAIMDNLSSHKNSRIIDKIPLAGVEVLFLPPYSPDLGFVPKVMV
jgi:transposase